MNETAKEPPQDEEGKNSPTSLAVEATYINQNFSQQMLVVRFYVCDLFDLSRARVLLASHISKPLPAF